MTDLITRLRALDTHLFPAEQQEALTQMLRDDLRPRRDAANRRDAEAWARVRCRADWEAFRDPRIAALRQSLGEFPPSPERVEARVTGTIDGDGCQVENLVYASHPGVLVTANLYAPSLPREQMPAILLVHSHHNPKTQGELQDMGMTWARQGCVVLVIDQLGYGERREHPEGPRQDYRFRGITGIQLHVVGDSLMGWMVWDILRGVDLLVSRAGVDRERIVVMGAVAGGGDPAAVAAALDSRIACAIPFNFGGPQPETTYPLPEDAETSFNYLGGGSWESTRNLRLSGRDGFLPWVIVGSVAPRCLIYAHEFSWDRERDPVWRRLQAVFGFYDAEPNLAFTHGAGLLSGRPPEATHCNNVGPVHRRMIYPALERWFGIPTPDAEVSERRAPEELRCLPAAGATAPAMPAGRPLHELLDEMGASRAAAARAALAGHSPDARRQHLREAWARLLGEVEPAMEPVVRSRDREEHGRLRTERVLLEVEAGIRVPLVLLQAADGDAGAPVVIGISQDGKATFLRERAGEIAALLGRGIAACLPDVRGTGETRPPGARERQSTATSLSATEWMLGQTLLGSRLRDLRSVVRYLRARGDLDAQRIAVWGDSFAPPNAAGFADPLLGEEEAPGSSEPLGGLLALFGALYEDTIFAIVARGMLAGYQSLLRDRFCYIPHDAVVPGALTAGDLCDVAAALAPRPLRLEALVDGRNCLMATHELRRRFAPAIDAYQGAPNGLLLSSTPTEDWPAWLDAALQQQ